MSEQLDLLDFIAGENRGEKHLRTERFWEVLKCMRDAMPEAMRFMIDLWAPPDHGPMMSGVWSYKWSAKQVFARQRVPGAEFQSITWDEFAEAVRDHPKRSAIIEWEQSISVPDKWRELTRPHELWPNPETWNPSYIEADHERLGWDKRFDAWKTLQRILNDALAEVLHEGAKR